MDQRLESFNPDSRLSLSLSCPTNTIWGTCCGDSNPPEIAVQFATILLCIWLFVFCCVCLLSWIRVTVLSCLAPVHSLFPIAVPTAPNNHPLSSFVLLTVLGIYWHFLRNFDLLFYFLFTSGRKLHPKAFEGSIP